MKFLQNTLVDLETNILQIITAISLGLWVTGKINECLFQTTVTEISSHSKQVDFCDELQ
jgi:hypothetical protein